MFGSRNDHFFREACHDATLLLLLLMLSPLWIVVVVLVVDLLLLLLLLLFQRWQLLLEFQIIYNRSECVVTLFCFNAFLFVYRNFVKKIKPSGVSLMAFVMLTYAAINFVAVIVSSFCGLGRYCQCTAIVECPSVWLTLWVVLGFFTSPVN